MIERRFLWLQFETVFHVNTLPLLAVFVNEKDRPTFGGGFRDALV
jgi:hypothetical protein